MTRLLSLWSLLSLILIARASPGSPSRDEVKDNKALIADFPPPIERPGGGDVWTVGDVEVVKWSTKGLNYTLTQVGTILLGYLTTDGSQRIFPYQSLADNFTLVSSSVNVVVPEVPSGNVYFIIVLGNTNNWSPLFAIVNPKASASLFPTSLAWASGSAAPSVIASATTVVDALVTADSTPSSPMTSGVGNFASAASTGVLSSGALSCRSIAVAPLAVMMGVVISLV
ncbi:hypothetical protein LXA43DRAFT_89788 [Ganoderma leucocontextum]|nr:hypothetical protein LXA43DRAFT_89788 [Ganoderma leucocontextum]